MAVSYNNNNNVFRHLYFVKVPCCISQLLVTHGVDGVKVQPVNLCMVYYQELLKVTVY